MTVDENVTGDNGLLSMIGLLCCVVCRVQVGLTPDRQGVQCRRCDRVYPIEDGIPQMLIEKAKLIAEAATDGTPPATT